MTTYATTYWRLHTSFTAHGTDLEDLVTEMYNGEMDNYLASDSRYWRQDPDGWTEVTTEASEIWQRLQTKDEEEASAVRETEAAKPFVLMQEGPDPDVRWHIEIARFELATEADAYARAELPRWARYAVYDVRKGLSTIKWKTVA